MREGGREGDDEDREEDKDDIIIKSIHSTCIGIWQRHIHIVNVSQCHD